MIRGSRMHSPPPFYIGTTLDKLSDPYDQDFYDQKCQIVYQRVYDSYYGAGRSIYASLPA